MSDTSKVIDMTGWKPDKSYDDCLKQCEELGLIEMAKHGDEVYGRVTQDGRNVLFALMIMATQSANPDNVLKQS